MKLSIFSAALFLAFPHVASAQVWPPCSSQTSTGGCEAVCPAPPPGSPSVLYWVSCRDCTRSNFQNAWPGILISASCVTQTGSSVTPCEGACRTDENPPRQCRPVSVTMFVRCDNGSQMVWFLRLCCAEPIT